jgi:hypothetical protein
MIYLIALIKVYVKALLTQRRDIFYIKQAIHMKLLNHKVTPVPSAGAKGQAKGTNMFIIFRLSRKDRQTKIIKSFAMGALDPWGISVWWNGQALFFGISRILQNRSVRLGKSPDRLPTRFDQSLCHCEARVRRVLWPFVR